MTVKINKLGEIISVNVINSSGYKVLDNVAKRFYFRLVNMNLFLEILLFMQIQYLYHVYGALKKNQLISTNMNKKKFAVLGFPVSIVFLQLFIILLQNKLMLILAIQKLRWI